MQQRFLIKTETTDTANYLSLAVFSYPKTMSMINKLTKKICRYWLLILISLAAVNFSYADETANQVYKKAAKADRARNYSFARTLYLPLAAQGDHRALNSLGVLYELGNGVAKDWQKAADYYHRAVEVGSIKAIGNLAAIYERGGYGLARNEEKALTYYFSGLNNGDGKSMNNLGVMVGTGEIFPLNIVAAWALYFLAVDYEDREAERNLNNINRYMSKAEVEQGYELYKQLRPQGDRVGVLLRFLDLE